MFLSCSVCETKFSHWLTLDLYLKKYELLICDLQVDKKINNEPCKISKYFIPGEHLKFVNSRLGFSNLHKTLPKVFQS